MRPFPARGLGLLVLAIYAVHAADILREHSPATLLWSCNVAVLAVAAGLLFRLPRANAAGGLMLAVGEPLWIIDIAMNGDFHPTSPLTHVGVLAISLWGAWRLGLPRHSWLAAVLLLAAATAAARFVGPPAEDVNLAHAIPEGPWKRLFPSLGAYLACLGAVLAAGAGGLEVVLRRAGFREEPRAAP